MAFWQLVPPFDYRRKKEIKVVSGRMRELVYHFEISFVLSVILVNIFLLLLQNWIGFTEGYKYDFLVIT